MDPERRQDIARLLHTLGDAWLLEPDAALLDRLSALPAFADVAGSLNERDLAITYSDVLLNLIPPYASLFLDEAGMLNAGPAEDVLRQYSRSGFEVQPAWRAGVPDHLGVELHYLGWLLESDGSGWEEFLRAHVLTWAPVCCLAVERSADDPLYPALARLTLDVLLSLESDAIAPEATDV